METKTCKLCGETKPITEFHPNGSRRPGYRTRCKKCYGNTYGTWYDSHKQEKHDAYKKWADAHPSERRERRLGRLYGMNLEEYQNMYDAQNGNCAICGKHEDKLHVDHSHDNGEVRALLCGNCNRGIGIMQDDISILESAINYLKGFLK